MGLPGYCGQDADLGEYLTHTPIVEDAGAKAGEFFSIIHTLFSDLKAWLVGTHHGVSAKHLPRYLREWAYRFNRRNLRDGLDISSIGISINMAAYAVLIPVAEQTSDCLVVMPYGKHESEYEATLERVFDAISRGVQDAGLKAVRLDRLHTGDILSQLLTSMQSATVVVADCSPDPTNPNSNVMYEIGLAHALGKPTILVKSGEAKLPANLSTKKFIPFKAEDSRSLSTLSREIFVQVTRIKNLLGGLPVHQEFLLSCAHILKARHGICLQEDFLPHLSRILKFATITWYSLQPLDNELYSLTMYAKDLFYDPLTSRERKLNLIGSTWNKYDTAALSVINNMTDLGFTQVGRSFDFMFENPKEKLFTKAMSRARAFFRMISEDLSAIPEQHAEIIRLYGGLRTQLDKEDYEGVGNLYMRLNNKHLGVQRCISQTHAMVMNIISNFAES
jgi:ISXO2-like transposase domain